MAFYGYKALGRSRSYGYVAYGSFSAYDILEGVAAFDEAWSFDDWKKLYWGSWQVQGYTPIASSTLERAASVWAKMQEHLDLNSPLASQYRSQMTTDRNALQSLASTVDNITRGHDYGAVMFPTSNTAANNNTRKQSYTNINNILLGIANRAVPDANQTISDAQDAADAKAAADAAAAKAAKDAADAAEKARKAAAAQAAAQLQQTQDAIAAAKQAIADANVARARAEASAVKNRELRDLANEAASKQSGMSSKKTVPLVLGGLAVLTAGAVFFARRNKK